MAWSPQARKAAALARRRKGGSKPHAKYSVVGKHPGNHKQFKAKARKVAKYTAVGVGVGAAAYGAYKSPPAQKQVRNQVSKRVRRDARARIAQKQPHINTIQTSRTLQNRANKARPGSLNHRTGPYAAHDRAVAGAKIRSINRYSKRTPYKRKGSKKVRYR